MKRLISVVLLMILSVFAFTACRRTPIDKNGVYSDGYIKFTLPEGHFIAADTSDEMGTNYHKYLMFKGERDFTGSNIIYMAFKASRSSVASADMELADIEATMRDQYADEGKEFKTVNFEKLDIPGCVGFVYEYDVSSDGSTIHHIMYSVVRKAQLEAVTVFFNCTNDELLEQYRASCDTISIEKK